MPIRSGTKGAKAPTSHMQATEYRNALAHLGFSQEAAAKWLGVSPRQGRRFALGEAPIPIGFSRLLRLMLERGIRPEEVK